MKKVLFLLVTLLAALGLRAQSDDLVFLTAANDGSTAEMFQGTAGYTIAVESEIAPMGGYNDGPYDRSITVHGVCEGEDFSMSLYFTRFDIDPHDTLFIYDGTTATGSPMVVANNNLNPLAFVTIFPSLVNTSNALTLRFKTNGDGNTGSGFHCEARCRTRCETVTPHIDSMYFKTRNGEITDTGYTRMVFEIDTTFAYDSTQYTIDENGDTTYAYDYDRFKYDTLWYRGVHLCKGEGVIFKGYGEYSHWYSYGPSDSWSYFRWDFGNGDTLGDVYAVLAPAVYRDLDCYDVTLRITDGHGCTSTVLETVRVRLAQNPIKTIYALRTICNVDSLIVNIGYEGDNATITMSEIEFAQAKAKEIDCKTFIPDGQNYSCPQADEDDCFFATIPFDEFPNGRVVTSAADICSVCINIEHSYLGDFRCMLVCPTGNSAYLWHANLYHDPDITSETPEGAYNGSSQYLGIPYGFRNDTQWDGQCAPGDSPMEPTCVKTDCHQRCDSICNMYGYGWEYCFSRNEDYTLVSGKPCNTTNIVPTDYICGHGNNVQLDNVTFGPVPSPFAKAGQTAAPSSYTTKKASNHADKTDYYLPAEDFQKLIGCPLNGEWSIKACDWFAQDNGWIFSWAIDFCGISSGKGCHYQVGIDSVVWTPDSAYGDFDQGQWRGVDIAMTTPVRSVIRTPDTAGYFPINVTIYDEFGCQWDTNTSLISIWTPQPNLGDNKLICDVENVILDASDRHTATHNYSFAWEPYGDSTATIESRPGLGTSRLYTVEVTNDEENVRCSTFDSVRVNINKMPTPNFDPGTYPLEGCEPFTLYFKNTSQDGQKHLWVFGDGDSSRVESPTHTYATGQYDFKYFIETEAGCKDSLVYSDLITVYSSPVARFSWEPVNPTVMHPEVQFKNMTIPQSSDNFYYWEIQYDRDNPISYHTLTDVNPSFEWYTDGEDISGSYVARLIAKTLNYGPSGLVIECRDTVENNILLVNDFLQFPNVVTPNGDGVNDKFIVRNLVDGMGYPNNSLAIYDRWGKRVYYKENISSEDDFWDPAKDNIPAGTYFWRFSGKGYLGDIQRNGVVEVIK